MFHITSWEVGVGATKIESTIIRNDHDQLVFHEEKIWVKKIDKIKKSLYSFTDKQLQTIRSEENSPYLADDSLLVYSSSFT